MLTSESGEDQQIESDHIEDGEIELPSQRTSVLHQVSHSSNSHIQLNEKLELRINTPIKTNPTLQVKPEIVEIGKTLIVNGRNFVKNSELSISLGEYVLPLEISDGDGSMSIMMNIPETIESGSYTLKVSDGKSGMAVHSITVKDPEPEPRPEYLVRVQQVTTDPEKTDTSPPISEVTFKGKKNCSTIESKEQCWYYDFTPVAEFSATDDKSEVKHIIVLYRGKFFLNSGDNILLRSDSSVHKGNVTFTYFAVDNEGNTENPKTASVMVDVLIPAVYVRKISTESFDNLAIGECKIEQYGEKCMVVPAKVGEKINFGLLVSDLISGVNATYYRVLEPSEMYSTDVSWTELMRGTTQIPILEIEFDRTGIYFVQLKVSDKAGNESDLKSYKVKVTI